MASTSKQTSNESAGSSFWINALGPFVLATPFFIFALIAANSNFISDQHAYIIEKALLAKSRGQLEVIGLVYPPIPFILAMPFPKPLFLSFVSALLAGYVLWILFRKMSYWRFSLPSKISILIAIIALPEMLFTATQSLSEVLGLLLLVLAWHKFISFTRHAETSAGFFAGLTLGLAFFVNHHVALYSLPFALLVPIYISDQRSGSGLASAFVLFFPMIIAFVSWLYLNWIFTGRSLSFLYDPAAAHMSYYTKLDSSNIAYGFKQALASTIKEVLQVPLFLFALAIVSLHRRIRLPALLIPLVLITITRAFSLVYPQHFAVLTLTFMGLVAIPSNTKRLWSMPLVFCMILQVCLAYTRAQPTDIAIWAKEIREISVTEKDKEETEIANFLKKLPDHSVLLDDRIAFRLVARSATADPFLLPADPLYRFAESNPGSFVEYILTPKEPMNVWQGRLARSYVEHIPANFKVLKEWSNWRVLQHSRIREG